MREHLGNFRCVEGDDECLLENEYYLITERRMSEKLKTDIVCVWVNEQVGEHWFDSRRFDLTEAKV
jgi:hypothetical protein